ncbi:MAG: hypothetical protein WD638_04845 [Nitriliruptoraceae bacterium]
MTTTPAQERLVDEVFAWGQERPRVSVDAVATLRATLDRVVGAVVERAAEAAGSYDTGAATPATVATFTASMLASEGAHSAGEPWRQDRTTVRGLALKQAFARDVEAGHTDPPGEVATAVLTSLARERPGDPASASHWLNTQGREVRGSIRDEIASVLADIRSLWPPLPREQLDLAVAPVLRIPVADGRVILTARPDLVLDSRHRDDRARALVLVTRAGMPRPAADRALARTHALLVALWSGRLPFRWGSLHLTDGRVEVEDLDVEVLRAAAETIGARIAASCEVSGGPGSTVGDPGARADEEEQGGGR